MINIMQMNRSYVRSVTNLIFENTDQFSFAVLILKPLVALFTYFNISLNQSCYCLKV